MILFDTDTVIEILRGNKRVLKRRAEYPGEVAIAFMTAAELFFGAENSAYPVENKVLVEKFGGSIEIGELAIEESLVENNENKDGRLLPAGIFARWAK